MKTRLVCLALAAVVCSAAFASGKTATAKTWIPKLAFTVPSHLQARQVLINMGKSAVPSLIEGMASRDELIRTQCADIVAKIGLTAVPNLRTALKSEEWRVRSCACMTLGEMPKTTEVNGLLVYALKDNNWWVRCMAANGLAGTGNEQAREVLEILANSDPDERVRERASIALDYSTSIRT